MDVNEIAKKSLIKGVKLGAEAATAYIDDIFVIKKARKTVKQLKKYIKNANILVDVSDDKVRIIEDCDTEQNVKTETVLRSSESAESCAHCGAFASSYYKYCPNCGSMILRRVSNEA